MSYLSEQLKEIEGKVKLLAEHNRELREEKSALQSELAVLRELVEAQKNTIKELEEKKKISKIADSVSLAAREKRELKLKINQYVREIDRCIALLND